VKRKNKDRRRVEKIFYFIDGTTLTLKLGDSDPLIPSSKIAAVVEKWAHVGNTQVDDVSER
jgi:hypothetical protein